MISGTWYLMGFPVTQQHRATHTLDYHRLHNQEQQPQPPPPSPATRFRWCWCSAGCGGGSGAWLADGCGGGLLYLLPGIPGMRRNTYFMYLETCFFQDDPWYLVNRHSTWQSFVNSVRVSTRAEGDGAVILRNSKTPSIFNSVVLSSRTLKEGDVRIL